MASILRQHNYTAAATHDSAASNYCCCDRCTHPWREPGPSPHITLINKVSMTCTSRHRGQRTSKTPKCAVKSEVRASSSVGLELLRPKLPPSSLSIPRSGLSVAAKPDIHHSLRVRDDDCFLLTTLWASSSSLIRRPQESRHIGMALYRASHRCESVSDTRGLPLSP